MSKEEVNTKEKINTKKEVNAKDIKVEDKKKKSTKSTNKSTEKKENSKKTSVKKNNSSLKRTSTKKKMEDSKDSISLEEADSFYHVSLLAQAVCVVGILAISVLAIFENSFSIPVEVLVGMTLLIMAYNNVKLFKRKGLTIVYIVFGVLSLFVGILGYFGVTV